MSLVEQIIAELTVKGQAQFSSDMKKAAGSTEEAGSGQQEVAKQSKLSASSMVRAAAAAGIVYKGFSLLKDSVSTTVQLAKDTAAFTRVTGLDQKQAQSWVLVAKERGLQVKTLQVGMATLGRNLGALGGKPSKSSITALDQLGISQAALIKMPMQQKLNTLADAFNNLPDGINKATLAQKLLGRTGTQMLPIFAGGAKGMNELLDSASKLVPANAASGKSALELVQKQRELNMAMEGVKVSIGSALIPVLSQAAKMLQPLATWFGRLLQICPPLGPALVVIATGLAGLLVFDKIATAARGFTAAMTAMKEATILQTAATQAQIVAIKIAEAVQWAWDAAMAANPIVLIIAALVALAVGLVIAYKKVGWFRDLVNAAFNGIKVAVSAVVTFITAAWTKGFDALKAVVTTVVNFIKDHWKLLAIILATILLGPLVAVAAAFFLLRGKVAGVLNAIKAAFAAVKKFVIAEGSGIASFFASIPKRIVGFFTGLPAQVRRATAGMFDGIKNAISSAVGFVSSKLQSILSLIRKVIGEVTSLPSKIASPVTSIASKIGGFAGGLVSKFATGGTQPRAGLALVGERGPEIVHLPGGATVTPIPAPAALTGGGGGRRPIVVQTFLEKRMIGQAVADYAGDLQAAR